MKRRSLSTRERARIFQLHDGVCHLCLGKIDGTREKWEVSHELPIELGGADDDSNMKPAHYKCHRVHTATVDVPTIAKAKRREAVYTGAKAPSKRPIASRGFPKSDRRKPASSPLLKPLPPRRLGNDT